MQLRDLSADHPVAECLPVAWQRADMMPRAVYERFMPAPVDFARPCP